LIHTQPDLAPNAADEHANVVPPDENTEAAMQSTAKAVTSLELEECKAKINTLENLVAELIKSTTISPATSTPKDDISPATNQDSPTILPETTDPTSNESPTVASAITTLQVKSKEFETAISTLNEDLTQDQSTRSKTLQEIQQAKTNTGRVFSSQKEIRKMIDNTDQKLSKASAEIDFIYKTVYGGYNIGDEISEDLFLSLPKTEVNSLKELRVKDSVLISEGNKCTYAVLNEKIVSNGNTKLVFVTGHDNEHPVFKIYHFESEWNWIHHTFHILPIGAFSIQKLNTRIALLQNDVKINISDVAKTNLKLKAHEDDNSDKISQIETNISAITELQIKSNKFEIAISAMKDNLTQDQSTRDLTLSKVCTDVECLYNTMDCACKTVYGGHKIGDPIPVCHFLSLPKAEAKSLKELEVEDGALILDGNQCAYVVLTKKIASDGKTELIFTIGYDTEKPVSKTYHFESEENWKFHTCAILPIEALNIQKVDKKLEKLTKTVTRRAIEFSSYTIKKATDQMEVQIKYVSKSNELKNIFFKGLWIMLRSSLWREISHIRK